MWPLYTTSSFTHYRDHTRTLPVLRPTVKDWCCMLFTKAFLCRVNAHKLARDMEHVTRTFNSLTNIITKHQDPETCLYIWFGYFDSIAVFATDDNNNSILYITQHRRNNDTIGSYNGDHKPDESKGPL